MIPTPRSSATICATKKLSPLFETAPPLYTLLSRGAALHLGAQSAKLDYDRLAEGEKIDEGLAEKDEEH